MCKFDNVPVDEDTRIKARVVTALGDFDALYEKWFWDGKDGENIIIVSDKVADMDNEALKEHGIYGESLIFVTDEVADMDDEALKEYVAESPLVKDKDSGQITMKRNIKGFTFVSFNFVVT